MAGISRGTKTRIINAWRIFALGDEITVSCERDAIQDEVTEVFYRLGLNNFVKDMILQLLVKGDCIGYRVANRTGDDIDLVIWVNPVSVRLLFFFKQKTAYEIST